MIKPVIVVSKCLGFAACRWNGQALSDPYVQSLADYVVFHTVCPECEIGLGIPRDPIRVVCEATDAPLRLKQPATKRDITDLMNEWVDRFFGSMGPVDGVILKHKSPSCGIYNVPIYRSMEKGAPIGKGGGFFGGQMRERASLLPIEDEGRLHNFTIREHFLTRIFTIAQLREVCTDVQTSGRLGRLVEFQSDNKLLLMSYNQDKMREAGRIVAQMDSGSLDERLQGYKEAVFSALKYPMRFTNAINALQHGMGYFKDKVSAQEKKYFLDSLEEYRAAKIPLSVILHMLRSWAVRFEEEYILRQSFFAPYPEALVEITDSGKGRSGR